ncbi:hypothetical protein DET57_12113 [Klebsiella oxytoca]|uniref:Uncharacterized protein n=1 Tax=Klebsiella oxytoca TaxID=571 RepID=A0A318FGB3_KLEOX|nr:hypothetical protein [Klebsiella oxytoca]PXW38967.1 hypothetical protein DET57_12113 [Klebsiella oxytoca]HCB1500998.1 hypothetical protein [Klebsiella michiganensis]HCB1847166.1 hypothetical protein [Klebsiella oxytoca]
MRDFDMHGQQHNRHFGRHRMAKPLIVGVVLIAILGLLVMSLWNALLPAILGVKSIGFWQALGILALSRILFGGLGFRPGMFGIGRERRRMHERWMKMSPEQRDEFIQRFGNHRHRGHCGWRERRDENTPHQEKPTKTTDPE